MTRFSLVIIFMFAKIMATDEPLLLKKEIEQRGEVKGKICHIVFDSLTDLHNKLAENNIFLDEDVKKECECKIRQENELSTLKNQNTNKVCRFQKQNNITNMNKLKYIKFGEENKQTNEVMDKNIIEDRLLINETHQAQIDKFNAKPEDNESDVNSETMEYLITNNNEDNKNRQLVDLLPPCSNSCNLDNEKSSVNIFHIADEMYPGIGSICENYNWNSNAWKYFDHKFRDDTALSDDEQKNMRNMYNECESIVRTLKIVNYAAKAYSKSTKLNFDTEKKKFWAMFQNSDTFLVISIFVNEFPLYYVQKMSAMNKTNAIDSFISSSIILKYMMKRAEYIIKNLIIHMKTTYDPDIFYNCAAYEYESIFLTIMCNFTFSTNVIKFLLSMKAIFNALIYKKIQFLVTKNPCYVNNTLTETFVKSVITGQRIMYGCNKSIKKLSKSDTNCFFTVEELCKAMNTGIKYNDENFSYYISKIIARMRLSNILIYNFLKTKNHPLAEIFQRYAEDINLANITDVTPQNYSDFIAKYIKIPAYLYIYLA